jgi:hypothetical protein
MVRLSETIPQPIPIAIKHSLLESLVALLAPEPTEKTYRNFYQNTAGAQRSIDDLWLRVQQLERAGKRGEQDRLRQLEALESKLHEQDQRMQEQHQALDQQAVRIQSLLTELNCIYQTRTWKLMQAYSRLKA